MDNEEEKYFERTDADSQDASNFNSFGGAGNEDDKKTDKEELEDAIEALEENDIEEPKAEQKEPEAPAIEEVNDEPEPAKAPSIKEEPVMTIDSVEEPKKADKKKGGAGWKIATFIFALFAIAGCTAAGYFFFFDGTTNFLGRTVESRQTATPAPSQPNQTQPATASTGKYIYLSGTDWAIKTPDNLQNISYIYKYSGSSDLFEGSAHDFGINAITKNTKGYQAAPGFLGDDENGNFQPLGYVAIADGDIKPGVASAPSLEFKLDDKWSVYYSSPQAANVEFDWEKEWLTETIGAIKSWLTNKDNYVKVK